MQPVNPIDNPTKENQIDEAIRKDAFELTSEYQTAKDKVAHSAKLSLEAQEKAAVFLCEKSKRIDKFTADAGYTSLKAGQAKTALLKLVRYKGSVLTASEFVEALLAEGFQISISLEDKLKPMSRLAYFRATNEQQRAHERKVKEAGQKTVYNLGPFEIGAFQHAFARHCTGALLNICAEKVAG